MRLLRFLFLLLVVASPSIAQDSPAPPAQAPQKNPIPDKFTNLQVLPKDIAKQQLVQTMRSFAMSTGMRCVGCHVSSDPEDKQGNDLSKINFADDSKKNKKIARIMLEMTMRMNKEDLPKVVALGENPDEVGPVTCFTCHQGKRHPVGKLPPPPPPPGAPSTPSPPPGGEKKE